LEGRVLETNPAVERMLGYTHEELRGMHFRDFTHPEDVGQDLRLFEELVEGKRESYELEVRYLGQGGCTGWVRLTVSLVRRPDGEPQFALGMTEDITERKRAEQRLREAQKMEVVGRLVGGVAHDFNNLLTGIMRYSDLLVAGLAKDGRLRPPCRGDPPGGGARGRPYPAVAGDFPAAGDRTADSLPQSDRNGHAEPSRAVDRGEHRAALAGGRSAPGREQSAGEYVCRQRRRCQQDRAHVRTRKANHPHYDCPTQGGQTAGGTFAGHRKDYVVSETEGIQFPRLNRVLR
jgi:PAS domain S-box-containing protein